MVKMQGEGPVNNDGSPMYHLRRNGPPSTLQGVSDVMDMFERETVIGRETRSVNYVLASSDSKRSQYISRIHAKVVRKDNNEHYLIDGSKSGIYVNDVKISATILLCDGDRVTFGHRKGHRLAPGTIVQQPNSEYQFLFERCSCVQNRLNENDQDSPSGLNVTDSASTSNAAKRESTSLDTAGHVVISGDQNGCNQSESGEFAQNGGDIAQHGTSGADTSQGTSQTMTYRENDTRRNLLETSQNLTNQENGVGQTLQETSQNMTHQKNHTRTLFETNQNLLNQEDGTGWTLQGTSHNMTPQENDTRTLLETSQNLLNQEDGTGWTLQGTSHIMTPQEYDTTRTLLETSQNLLNQENGIGPTLQGTSQNMTHLEKDTTRTLLGTSQNLMIQENDVLQTLPGTKTNVTLHGPKMLMEEQNKNVAYQKNDRMFIDQDEQAMHNVQKVICHDIGKNQSREIVLEKNQLGQSAGDFTNDNSNEPEDFNMSPKNKIVSTSAPNSIVTPSIVLSNDKLHFKDFSMQTSPISDFSLESEKLSQEFESEFDKDTDLIFKSTHSTQDTVENALSFCFESPPCSGRKKLSNSQMSPTNDKIHYEKSSSLSIISKDSSNIQNARENILAHNSKEKTSDNPRENSLTHDSKERTADNSRENSLTHNSKERTADNTRESSLRIGENSSCSIRKIVKDIEFESDLLGNRSKKDMKSNERENSVLDHAKTVIDDDVAKYRSKDDFEKALSDLKDIVSEENMALGINNNVLETIEHADFDSVLTDLENIVKNNVCEKDSDSNSDSQDGDNHKKIISSLVKKFFKIKNVTERPSNLAEHSNLTERHSDLTKRTEKCSNLTELSSDLIERHSDLTERHSVTLASGAKVHRTYDNVYSEPSCSKMSSVVSVNNKNILNGKSNFSAVPNREESVSLQEGQSTNSKKSEQDCEEDDIQFLFEEKPFTTEKVKVEDEFVSSPQKTPQRKSCVSPRIDNYTENESSRNVKMEKANISKLQNTSTYSRKSSELSNVDDYHKIESEGNVKMEKASPRKSQVLPDIDSDPEFAELMGSNKESCLPVRDNNSVDNSCSDSDEELPVVMLSAIKHRCEVKQVNVTAYVSADNSVHLKTLPGEKENPKNSGCPGFKNGIEMRESFQKSSVRSSGHDGVSINNGVPDSAQKSTVSGNGSEGQQSTPVPISNFRPGSSSQTSATNSHNRPSSIQRALNFDASSFSLPVIHRGHTNSKESMITDSQSSQECSVVESHSSQFSSKNSNARLSPWRSRQKDSPSSPWRSRNTNSPSKNTSLSPWRSRNTNSPSLNTPLSPWRSRSTNSPSRNTPLSPWRSRNTNSPLRPSTVNLSQEFKDRYKKKIKKKKKKFYQSYIVNKLIVKFRRIKSSKKAKNHEKGKPSSSVRRETVNKGKDPDSDKTIFENAEVVIISADSDTDEEMVVEKVKVKKKKKKKRRNKNGKHKETSNNEVLGGQQSAVGIMNEIPVPVRESSNQTADWTISPRESSNLTADWPMNAFPQKSPYIPQIGDEVMYFRQGHLLYLEEVKKKKLFVYDPIKFEPWQKLPYLGEQELVRVDDIKFEILHPKLCNLKLTCLDPASNRETGEYFNVIYHDIPNVIDFIVLKQTYHTAMERKWKKGDRFCSLIENSWWMGTILSQSPFDIEYTDSMFMCFKVRWDNKETETISPWDMEPITEKRKSVKLGGGVPADLNELVDLVYTPQQREWPSYGCVQECDRITNAINLLMEKPVVQSFHTRNSNVSHVYPINLDLLRERLKNGFYRRLNAVKFDIAKMLDNAEKSGNPDLIVGIRVVTETLQTFISMEKCTDPLSIFEKICSQHSVPLHFAVNSNVGKKMASGKRKGNDSIETVPKRQKMETVRVEAIPDWKQTCINSLTRICKFFSEDEIKTNKTWQNFDTILDKLQNGGYQNPIKLGDDVRKIFELADSYILKKECHGMHFAITGLSLMFEEEMKKIKEEFYAASCLINNHSKPRQVVQETSSNPGPSTSSYVSSTAQSMTGSVPAPHKCFKQWSSPPDNKFVPGMKLEAVDARNASSICVATVVGCVGPRLILRLDGSDNMNDFWRLVDSEDIFPVGHCEEEGHMIMPPLGFEKDLSVFHQFLIQTLVDANVAPEGCFKKTPPTPQENFFEVGMKLEAIDKKHPHLICPATVDDVDGDHILVTFDGWLDYFNYWCRFDSRDIFPVGWCEQSGHILQQPGKKVPKTHSKKKAATKQSKNSKTLQRSTSQQSKKTKLHPALSRSSSVNESLQNSNSSCSFTSSSGIDSGSEFVP